MKEKNEQRESNINVSADRLNIGNLVTDETEQLDLIIIIIFSVMKKKKMVYAIG